MRRAIAIILSAVLVTTPIKVVLAQADQRESQVAATDSIRIQTPARIGVPVVEPNSGSALLKTNSASRSFRFIGWIGDE